IPLAQVESAVDKIASDKNVVVHCRSGARSAKAIAALEKKYGFKNLYNLKGGILAWANEIDPTMAKY
ncbi:MAG: rhodanese-like domain-containing protein, partial [Bacteroidota bacterium]|nr:rhodanese-like domain-containing protein [Bacteroidota bacterium]